MGSVAQHTGVIYLLTAPTGERYVGRTTDYAERMRHYRAGGHGKVAAAIALYGWDAFTHQPIAVGVADAALPATEFAFIEMLKPELNLQTASYGRVRHAESSKRKIAEAHRGKPKSPEHRKNIAAAKRNPSPETREKIAASKRGKPGKPHSAEAREKIAASKRGKPRSPETRAKLAAYRGEKHHMFSKPAHNRGKSPSDETREKLRAATRGENNPFFDKSHSAESRKKMKLSARERCRVPAIHKRLRELRELGWPLE